MQQTQNRITQHDLSSLPTRIRVVGYTYLVDFFGPTTQPRFHTVNKQRRCSCELGEGRSEASLKRTQSVRRCPAIEAVAEYLLNGGQRAPDPMPPCPICGAETVRDRKWDGKYTKELGWRCTAGGLRHFLEAKAERIIRMQQHSQVLRQQSADSEHKSAAGR